MVGWVAYPALTAGLSPMDAGLLRIKSLTIGLIWQFVLAMIILYRKEEFLFCGVLLPKRAGLLGK